MSSGVRYGRQLAHSPSEPVVMSSDRRVVALTNASNPVDVEEYSYGPTPKHLTESQVLEHYRRALSSKEPGTLVVLTHYDCDHWNVIEYKTPDERQKYFKNLLATYINRVFQAFAAR